MSPPPPSDGFVLNLQSSTDALKKRRASAAHHKESKVTKSLQVAKAQYDVPSYLTQLLVTFIFIYGLYKGIMPLRQLHLAPHPVHMLNGKTNQGTGAI